METDKRIIILLYACQSFIVYILTNTYCMCRGQHAAVFDISSELFTQVGIYVHMARSIYVGGKPRGGGGGGGGGGTCNHYLWEMNEGSLYRNHAQWICVYMEGT